MQPNPLLQAIPDLRTQMKNPISFEIPKLIYDECFLLSDNNTRLFKKLGRFDNCFSELSLENHMRFFNIFNTYILVNEDLEGENIEIKSLRLPS